MLLIDGDILVYRVGFACQRTKEDGRVEIEPEWRVKLYVYRMMNKIQRITKHWKYKMYLTSNDKSNYRFQEAKSFVYKGNRLKMDKPKHYNYIREHLLSNYNAEMIYNQEADDAMSIEQMKDYPNGKTIICTIDKDLNNTPGWHFNFETDTKYWVDMPEANKNFYRQMLTGDTADNIPGSHKLVGKKCGKKTANDILADAVTEKELFDKVYEYYKKHGLDEKVLLEIGRCLWVRRKENEVWEFPL